MTTIGLIGNPNCGKTTLFNTLTGSRQRVGNWPGVTVERKSGWWEAGSRRIEVVDLPGTYGLSGHEPGTDEALDEAIARGYVTAGHADVLINVVDATSLARGLYLTLELLEQNVPVVVALNMMDVADRSGMRIDVAALAKRLGCPVVPIVAPRRASLGPLLGAIDAAHVPVPLPRATPEARYAFIDALVADAVQHRPPPRTVTERIDRVVLNPYLAFPIFLAVMYLMFTFTITIGSAFIDLFDMVAGVLVVEIPRAVLLWLGSPAWLVALLADGVGGGVQLVATFVPVIGCMFLFLALLEDSGYMGRVAFIVDRLLKRLRLPGKSFVPLIVGFGCNVPAVMATRTLDSQPDRILTTIMAPFMSCGARLTVYALFAAAFFPGNGQNVVFALYLTGIAVAVGSALLVRRHIVAGDRTPFVLELPAYHLPRPRGLILHAWQRLKGFVLRAGKAIVTVVVVLNVVNSVGTDLSFGNENTEKSALSAIGKSITPLFAPMGVRNDNWPATVGIFTGIFAKEVVVGTLDALYSSAGQPDDDTSMLETLAAAVATVPANFSAIGAALVDPLGLDLGDLSDTARAADNQGVRLTTVRAMQSLFDGPLGAFSYLLFILLYMPCVATVGAIYREIGAHWAVFSTAWSFVIAYVLATLFYQAGQLAVAPGAASITIVAAAAGAASLFVLLIRWGRNRHHARLIQVTQLPG